MQERPIDLMQSELALEVLILLLLLVILILDQVPPDEAPFDFGDVATKQYRPGCCTLCRSKRLRYTTVR